MSDTKHPPSPNDVRAALKHPGIVSRAALAREAGLHENTLRSVDSPEWSPRWKTLVALCDAADKLIAAHDSANK